METKCPDCGHLFGEGNLHGLDQNDAWIEHDENGNPRIVHSGRCTYCKICRSTGEGMRVHAKEVV